MQRWEYKVVNTFTSFFLAKINSEEIASILNREGQSGWEVTGIIPGQVGEGRTREIAILLKRPVG